jgi:hypothetical protein
MLTTILLIRLILAFAVGSIWVATVTVITERKGTTWGVLGGFPSTAAFALLFIGINQSPAVAVDASIVLPVVFSVSNACLLLYAFSARKGFAFGFGISLLAWLGFSAVVVALGLNDYAVSLASGAVISSLTLVAFLKIKLPRFEGQSKLYGKKEILVRGSVAGTIVALTVLLSEFGGPIIGGIAASFPAVYVSTLIIMTHSKGAEFSRSITRPLAVSGIFTVIPYSVVVHFLYPLLGIWLGTLLAYLAVTPLAVLSYLIVKKTKQNANKPLT